MKQKLLLLGALFFGFLAFILTYQQIDAEKRKLAGDMETVYVIKLTRAVAAGEELKSTDMARDSIQRSRTATGSLREIPWSQHEMYVGRKLETSLSSGQHLQFQDLKQLAPNQGFTRKIQKGMRAVPIPVDLVSSVNNLVKPNDDVDILGTFRFPDAKGDSSLDTVTMTMLQNVKVLAVGGRWDSFAGDPRNRSNYSTVTLLVYPDEAELLVFASQKGRLSLVLRNFDDTVIDNSGMRKIDFSLLNKLIPSYNQKRMERRLR